MSEGNSGTLTLVNRKALVGSLLAKLEEAMNVSSFGEEYENVVRYLKELHTRESQPRGVVGTFTVLEVEGRKICCFIFPDWVVSSNPSGDRAFLSLNECPEDVLSQIATSICKEFGFDGFNVTPESCPCGKSLARGAGVVGGTVEGCQYTGGKVAFIY